MSKTVRLPEPQGTGAESPSRRERASRASIRQAEESVDLDELARLRAEVERLRNELFLARKECAQVRRQSRAEAYRQLVESLGHELRTSLTLVLGWTELLVNGKLTADKRTLAHDTVYAAGWRVEAALRSLERAIARDLQPVEHELPTGTLSFEGLLAAASAYRPSLERPSEH